VARRRLRRAVCALTRERAHRGAVDYGRGQHLAERVNLALGDTALALVLGVLVLATSNGIGGPIGRVLSARPIVYLGTISYGIYIFHLLVPTAYNTAARHWKALPDAHHGFVYFCLISVITIVVAVPSWELLERPISELKRFFPYDRQTFAPPSRDDAVAVPDNEWRASSPSTRSPARGTSIPAPLLLSSWSNHLRRD